MRIGMLVDMYLPHVSGVTNHISLYKRRFEQLGHEVFVLTFGDLDYQDAEPNVVRSAGIPWGSTGWRMAPTFGAHARRLLPTLDVLHAHHPFQSGRLALEAARRHKTPLVFTNHTRYDLYSDVYASFVPKHLRYSYIRRALSAFTHRCDLVVAPADSIAEWLRDFAGYPDAVVIPNGIDTRAFGHPAHPVTRHEIGLADDDVVFCYAGRLGHEKNSVHLAEEFARAAAACPRARLLIVGDGPARADVEAALAASAISDRARFLGMMPYERIPGLEAVADAFVTASVTEVHPLVVLEAMAAGLPVIAVSSPGISDTVVDGVNGLLAPDLSPGVLGARIERLCSDDALRASLSSNARESARSYALENTADVLLGHYESLLARDGGRA